MALATVAPDGVKFTPIASPISLPPASFANIGNGTPSPSTVETGTSVITDTGVTQAAAATGTTVPNYVQTAGTEAQQLAAAQAAVEQAVGQYLGAGASKETIVTDIDAQLAQSGKFTTDEIESIIGAFNISANQPAGFVEQGNQSKATASWTALLTQDVQNAWAADPSNAPGDNTGLQSPGDNIWSSSSPVASPITAPVTVGGTVTAPAPVVTSAGTDPDLTALEGLLENSGVPGSGSVAGGVAYPDVTDGTTPLTQTPTTSSGESPWLYLIILGALAIGGFLWYRHAHKGGAAHHGSEPVAA
jgi:hypothetical protein